jgi:hypothetical protein
MRRVAVAAFLGGTSAFAACASFGSSSGSGPDDGGVADSMTSESESAADARGVYWSTDTGEVGWARR